MAVNDGWLLACWSRAYRRTRGGTHVFSLACVSRMRMSVRKHVSARMCARRDEVSRKYKHQCLLVFIPEKRRRGIIGGKGVKEVRRKRTIRGKKGEEDANRKAAKDLNPRRLKASTPKRRYDTGLSLALITASASATFSSRSVTVGSPPSRGTSSDSGSLTIPCSRW